MNSYLKSWIRIGSISGLLGLCFYFLAVFPFLSYEVSRLIAFFIGPLLIIAFLGLYNLIKSAKDSPLNQIAVVFAIIAGTLLNVMLVVQASIKATMYSKIENAADETIIQSLKQILSGLHTIHLGLDISWDIFIGLTIFLFGVSMVKSKVFNTIFSSISIALGFIIITLNLYTFPIPPAYTGLFDIGPFVAVYLIVLFFLMLLYSYKNIQRTG